MSERRTSEFESIATKQRTGGLATELFAFLRDNRKWWMLPMVGLLLLLGALALLSGTVAAPFIYTIF